MRVYISGDIEGVTGLVSWFQCGRPDGKHFDYPFARRMYLHDVNAAIRGARAAGATRIVVKDSHDGMKNLLIDELEPGVELISGHGSGFDGMMQGVGEGFDAAMLVGYHAMAGGHRGIMEHTISGGVHRLSLNGMLAGEIALAVATAGTYGVPVAMVSSDAVGCAEAAALLPGLSTAVTKEGYGRYMGRLLHPSETGPLIEAAAERGLRQPPATWVPEGPVTLTLEVNRAEQADLGELCPGVTRLDAYTLEGTYPDFREAHRAIWILMELSAQGIRALD